LIMDGFVKIGKLQALQYAQKMPSYLLT